MKAKVPPPIFLLVFGGLMWLLGHSPLAFAVSMPFSEAISGAVFVAGAAIAATAVRQFQKSATTIDPRNPTDSSTLVTHGIYQYTRNPMYVGLFLILFAWALLLESLANLVLLGGFVVTITQFQIRPEEAALRQLFSTDYEQYCRSVRRWI